jgi:hypothetical protein
MTVSYCNALHVTVLICSSMMHIDARCVVPFLRAAVERWQNHTLKPAVSGAPAALFGKLPHETVRTGAFSLSSHVLADSFISIDSAGMLVYMRKAAATHADTLQMSIVT